MKFQLISCVVVLSVLLLVAGGAVSAQYETVALTGRLGMSPSHWPLLIPSNKFVVMIDATWALEGVECDRSPAAGVGANTCTIDISDSPGSPGSSVAIYTCEKGDCASTSLRFIGAGTFADLGTGISDRWRNIREASLASNKSSSVGILYSGWHTYAAQVVKNQTKPQPPITIEDVVRSNGNLTVEDMFASISPAKAKSFYYQARPAELGFYCIYRKRVNESGLLPDCENITQTLTRHASLLTAAGVDYVAYDATYLPTYSVLAEVIQVRPFEVLAEEWTMLRRAGINTPRITIWQRVSPGATLWQQYLDNVYNKAEYADIIQRDPVTNKFLFFIPKTTVDQGIVNQIESNGGRNNIVVVPMWANLDETETNAGVWSFFAACVDPATDKFTTTPFNMPTCNQRITRNSPLGSAATVSPSYQLGYGSLPFQAPGKLSGSLFRFQFADALRANTDHLMVSSFNEWIAQPQRNPFHGYEVASMGLEWDAFRENLFVDSFGCDISRDIEPSEQCGSIFYDILSSCTRARALLRREIGSGASRSEFMEKLALIEPMCAGTPGVDATPSDVRLPVWSLVSKTNDYLLTIEPHEVEVLTRSGEWQEVCNVFNGPTVFCTSSSLQTSPMSATGPFLLGKEGKDGQFPMRVLYRCLTSQSRHLFSTNPNCTLPGSDVCRKEKCTMEGPLGFLATQRSTQYPRSVRACEKTLSPGVITHYHSLDHTCQQGDTDRGVLGYAH